MKRYNTACCQKESYSLTEEASDGDYVLHSDHEQAIAELQAKLDVAVGALINISNEDLKNGDKAMNGGELVLFAREALAQIKGDV